MSACGVAILTAMPVYSQAPRYVAAATPAANAASAPQPVDECQVVAKINGELVLAGELLWELNLRLEDAGPLPTGQEEEVRQQLMQQLLMQKMDLRLLYADFRRSAPQADLEKIHESLRKPFEENEIPRLMEMVGVEERQDLGARLVQLGTSLSERREEYYKVQIARSWVQEGLDFNREVTHQDLLDFYRDNAEKYDYPTQAKWEELMVSFNRYPTKADAYRELANLGNEAIARVRAAPDRSQPAFGPLAQARSHGVTAGQGGVYDWTTQGALTAERVDEALFALPIGEMSPILESDQGFHIVRVLDRKQAGRTPFTEVQTAIREKIIDERFSEAINAKMTSLKNTARVWTVYTGELDREEDVAQRAGGPTR